MKLNRVQIREIASNLIASFEHPISMQQRIYSEALRQVKAAKPLTQLELDLSDEEDDNS